jgi:hypothetical protein
MALRREGTDGAFPVLDPRGFYSTSPVGDTGDYCSGEADVRRARKGQQQIPPPWDDTRLPWATARAPRAIAPLSPLVLEKTDPMLGITSGTKQYRDERGTAAFPTGTSTAAERVTK